ncbi:MAG TPA: dCTP deaminase [Candidatus Omnitrophota bacterium]|nr:dCTP deaminase [Candidatus Omnitrophota bacterium]
MFLSDRDILEAIKKGDIQIEPFENKNVQPGSIDLTLDDGFKILDDSHERGGVIEFDEEPFYLDRTGSFILSAGQFALGTTLEYITLAPNIVASVQGRSSIGRRGLFIQNAGWIDPGFEGTLTLELYNPNRLGMRLKPGMRICQVFFGYTKTSAEHPYQGKYSGQRGTTGSRSFRDREYSS